MDEPKGEHKRYAVPWSTVWSRLKRICADDDTPGGTVIETEGGPLVVHHMTDAENAKFVRALRRQYTLDGLLRHLGVLAEWEYLDTKSDPDEEGETETPP